MPLLLLCAFALALWAAWGLVDWSSLGDYLEGIRDRFAGE